MEADGRAVVEHRLLLVGVVHVHSGDPGGSRVRAGHASARVPLPQVQIDLCVEEDEQKERHHPDGDEAEPVEKD